MIKVSSSANRLTYASTSDLHRTTSVSNQVTKPASTGLRYVRFNTRAADRVMISDGSSNLPADQVVNISFTTPLVSTDKVRYNLRALLLAAVEDTIKRLDAEASSAHGYLTETETPKESVLSLNVAAGQSADLNSKTFEVFARGY